ncbi:unnamed protein product [Mucor hiemalis]
MPVNKTQKSTSPSTNNRKRKIAPNNNRNASNKKEKKSTSKEGVVSNSAFWKKKFLKEDGEESEETPYQHLWNFLAKDEGRYLFAFERWQYKGEGIAKTVAQIVKEAKDYLDAQKVPVKDLEPIRSAMYKIHYDCLAAKKMEDESGAGNETNEAFADALKKKCPVWDQAKEYYLSKNSGVNLDASSTLNTTSVSSTAENDDTAHEVNLFTGEEEGVVDEEETDIAEEEETDVFAEDGQYNISTEPARSNAAKRTIDSFFNRQLEYKKEEEEEDQLFASALEDSTVVQREKNEGELSIQRKKAHGDLVL